MMPPPRLTHSTSTLLGILPPIHIRNISDDAEGEREAEIVVRVFERLRPGRERARAHQRQQQRFAEGDVQPRDREDDEAGCRHPVHEAFDRVEAHDGAARAAPFDADHAAVQVEADQEEQHAEDRNRADPFQRDLMKGVPVAAAGLDQHAFLLVRNADAAADIAATLKRVEELILLHRARGRIDGCRLLRDGRRGDADQEDDGESQRGKADMSEKSSHSLLPIFLLWSEVGCGGKNPAAQMISIQDAMVSR